MQAEAALPKPWRHPVFQEMRVRIDELEEEVRQLREQLVPPLVFPKAWRVVGQRSRLLSTLYAAQGYRSADQLCTTVRRSDGDALDPDHLMAVVWGLRARLRPRGIEIVTVKTCGYALTPESRPIIAKALADVAAGRCA